VCGTSSLRLLLDGQLILAHCCCTMCHLRGPRTLLCLLRWSAFVPARMHHLYPSWHDVQRSAVCWRQLQSLGMQQRLTHICCVLHGTLRVLPCRAPCDSTASAAPWGSLAFAERRPWPVPDPAAAQGTAADDLPLSRRTPCGDAAGGRCASPLEACGTASSVFMTHSCFNDLATEYDCIILHHCATALFPKEGRSTPGASAGCLIGAVLDSS
jgi:hypothetical protein